DYELAVFREWLSRDADLPADDALWSHKAAPGLKYPWQTVDGSHPEEKELKKRDAWLKLFMPQGALVATRVETNHWLTFGCEEPLPVMAFRDPVLMAAEGVEVPIRLGYLAKTGSKPVDAAKPGPNGSDDKENGDSSEEKKDGPKKDGDGKDKKEPPRVGWSALPPG